MPRRLTQKGKVNLHKTQKRDGKTGVTAEKRNKKDILRKRANFNEVGNRKQ